MGYARKWRVSRERASGERSRCSLTRLEILNCCSPLARVVENFERSFSPSLALAHFRRLSKHCRAQRMFFERNAQDRVERLSMEYAMSFDSFQVGCKHCSILIVFQQSLRKNFGVAALRIARISRPILSHRRPVNYSTFWRSITISRESAFQFYYQL